MESSFEQIAVLVLLNRPQLHQQEGLQRDKTE